VKLNIEDTIEMTLEFQPVSEIGKLLLGSPFSGQIDDILSVDSKLSDDKSIVRIYVRHGANLVALNVSTSRGNLTSRNNSSEWTLEPSDFQRQPKDIISFANLSVAGH
jgi:hypothetical protein